MNELEEKKWMASRIDIFHNYLLSELKSSVDKASITKNEIISSSNTQKNNRFAILGILLTIELGVASIYPIEPVIFFPILIALVVFGMIVLIMYNYAQKLAEQIFSFLEGSVTKERNIVEISFGYTNTRFFDLNSLSLDSIRNYHEFSNVLFYGMKVNSMLEITQYAEKFTGRFKEPIKSDLNKLAEPLKPFVKILHDNKHNFEQTDEIPKELLSFVETTLTNSKKLMES